MGSNFGEKSKSSGKLLPIQEKKMNGRKTNPSALMYWWVILHVEMYETGFLQGMKHLTVAWKRVQVKN